jgi:hypothetical protein
MTDYAKITADPVRGPEIGRLYMQASPFVTTLARLAYRQFAEEVERQFSDMVRDHGIYVIVQDHDPYPSHHQMFYDVRHHKTLQVYRTSARQGHPLISPDVNDMFRAVHDFHGHCMTGRGFDRHGEEAAWVRHSAMFTGLARRAMTTETRGQSSALCWLLKGTGEFPPQKAILLPDWVSRIPERWTS